VTSALPMTPGRRAILAAGVPIALAVIALGTAGWVHTAVRILVNQAQVGYSVALTAPVSNGQVQVTTSGADMTFRTGGGRQIQVRGRLSGSLLRPTFSHRSTAAGLSLDPACRGVGNCSLRFAVTAPSGLPTAIHDSYGNLDAQKLRGTVVLSDNSGDLTARDLTGDIRLANTFGQLTASGLAGTIQLDNTSGDITAARVTGNTQLRDSYGQITVTGLAAADVVARNQSGDVTLTFTKVPRRVAVTDAYGSITLRLPPGPAAYRVEAHTSYGIRTVSVPQAASAPNVITATNNSGDITIVNR
jgi:hypothetical protein